MDGCPKDNYLCNRLGQKAITSFYAHFLLAISRAARVIRTIVYWNRSEYVTAMLPPP